MPPSNRSIFKILQLFLSPKLSQELKCWHVIGQLPPSLNTYWLQKSRCSFQLSPNKYLTRKYPHSIRGWGNFKSWIVFQWTLTQLLSICQYWLDEHSFLCPKCDNWSWRYNAFYKSSDFFGCNCMYITYVHSCNM